VGGRCGEELVNSSQSIIIQGRSATCSANGSNRQHVERVNHDIRRRLRALSPRGLSPSRRQKYSWRKGGSERYTGLSSPPCRAEVVVQTSNAEESASTFPANRSENRGQDQDLENRRRPEGGYHEGDARRHKAADLAQAGRSWHDDARRFASGDIGWDGLAWRASPFLRYRREVLWRPVRRGRREGRERRNSGPVGAISGQAFHPYLRLRRRTGSMLFRSK
jgi:hypothetical protein